MVTQIADQIRVVLIDDHAVMRAGLHAIIASEPAITVIAEAANRAQAISAVDGAQPHVILLDLDLGDDNGLELLPELIAAAPDARVLLLTGLRDPDVHRRAVRLGAMGVVRKEVSVETLVKAIKKVHAGEVWLERSMVAEVLSELTLQRATGEADPETAKMASLTAREREIVAQIGAGLKSQQIADRLSVSEATVRNHLTSIFSKLDVADRVELVVYAYRHGLARLPGEP